jgi:hypothetical protein
LHTACLHTFAARTTCTPYPIHPPCLLAAASRLCLLAPLFLLPLLRRLLRACRGWFGSDAFGFLVWRFCRAAACNAYAATVGGSWRRFRRCCSPAFTLFVRSVQRGGCWILRLLFDGADARVGALRDWVPLADVLWIISCATTCLYHAPPLPPLLAAARTRLTLRAYLPAITACRAALRP